MFLTVPFTSYSFEVLADTTQGEGEFSIPRSFTTLWAPPTSPLKLSVSVISYSSLLVSWSPPTCSNGIISGYMVRGSMILKQLYLLYANIGDIHSINWCSIKSLQCVKCYHTSTSKSFKLYAVYNFSVCFHSSGM